MGVVGSFSFCFQRDEKDPCSETAEFLQPTSPGRGLTQESTLITWNFPCLALFVHSGAPVLQTCDLFECVCLHVRKCTHMGPHRYLRGWASFSHLCTPVDIQLPTPSNT